MEANDVTPALRHPSASWAALCAAPTSRQHALVATAGQCRGPSATPEGVLGARRGAVVTVERVVDDLRPWSHLVRIPAHRVLAVCETAMGAHPGGLFPGDLPVDGYGEDYEFWVEARAASRGDDFDEWIRHWVLDVEDQHEYPPVSATTDWALRAKADPDCGTRTRPTRLDAPNRWSWLRPAPAPPTAARTLNAVLAGAGVANLSAWLGVAQARPPLHALTAEIGLWGYEPTPADPFVLNHRNSRAQTLGDAGSSWHARRRAGTTTVAPRRAGRPVREHQSSRRPRRSVPRGLVVAMTLPASPPRRIVARPHARPYATGVRYITSPGRPCAPWSRIHAEKIDGDELRSRPSGR
jgi:hypothetical protein